MALSTDALSPSGQFDLAQRRAVLLRRRRRGRRRELLGLLVVTGLALWFATAALVALMAR